MSGVGGKQIRRQKRKSRLDSSLLAHSRLSTAISASLVSRPGRFFAFPRMPRTGRAALLIPLSPSSRLIFFYTRGSFSTSVLQFRSSLSSTPRRRQTLCALPGALTTGGCQPFNLAWRLSGASSWSTNFVLIAHERCNLDDWIGLKRRCMRREDILKLILISNRELHYDARRGECFDKRWFTY